jgi:hypothetical protein
MRKTRRQGDKKTGVRKHLFSHSSFLIPHSSFLIPHSSFLNTFHISLFTLLLLSTAFATTYQTDASGGPETLNTEVTESFEAWKTLDDKLEVSPVEENPESLFQYGAPERFSPDTLSITVQRQQESRQLLHLISPNAENRKQILLHEVGIAIGLTPQSTPSLSTPAPSNEAPSSETSTASETTETTGTDTTSTQEGTTDSTAQTEATETTETGQESTDTTTSENTESTENTDTTQEESSDTSTDGTSTDGTTTDDTSTDGATTDEGTQTSDATQEDTSDTSTEPDTSTDTPTSTEATEDSATPAETEVTPEATTIKAWETVMNPSINPDDKTELGDGEKELLKLLNLFAKEDINKDGNINFYDLVAISQAFGQRNVNDPSDINKDGLVNQADVDLLRKVYTFSDPSETAPGQTTPENPEGQTGPEGDPVTDTNTNDE